MKKRLKNKIFDHVWLKLLAVLLAIMIWLVVMNVEDYKVTKKITGIPVEQLNGEVIEELDKVYDVTEGETVDIIIKGRRTLVDSLKADDFVAKADLSKMSITNTVQITIEAKNKSVGNDITISCQDSTMILSIEDKISAQFPLIVVTTGTVADGYALGTCVTTPNIVSIEGPKSVVEKVTEIRAVVDVSNKYTSFETAVTPTCYDAYGESMKTKKITIDTDKVNVSIPVYPTKEVPLEVETVGTPANGYKVTEINYHPQTLKIAGDKDVLADIASINIKNISVSGKLDSIETNIEVDDYLPKGVYLADVNSQIAINITIEKLVDRNIVLSANDIKLTNVSDDLSYEVIIPENYFVTVTGLSADVLDLTSSDLGAIIDCVDFSVGDNEVFIQTSQQDKYNITNETRVVVKVTVKDKDDTATEETTAEDTKKQENTTEDVKTTEQ